MNASVSADPPASPGRERSVPGREAFRTLHLPSWAPARVFSVGTRRVAVCGGLGAGVRSLGAGCRTMEPGLPRGILKQALDRKSLMAVTTRR